MHIHNIQNIVRTLTNERSQAKLIIFSGPSGSGKGTIRNSVIESYGTLYRRQLYYTTRPMGDRDKNVHEYQFDTLEKLIVLSQSRLFALQPLHNFWHGIDLEEVDDALRLPSLTVLEVGRFMAQHLMRLYPDAQTIFLLPLPAEDLDLTDWTETVEQKLRTEITTRHQQRGQFDPETNEAQMRLDEGILQIRERHHYKVVIKNQRGRMEHAVEEFVRQTLKPFVGSMTES